MEKLSVCLLNDSFPPLLDGVANVVLNYADIIEKRYGHAVVATPSHPDARDNYPYPVVRFPSMKSGRFSGYRVGLPVSPATIRELSKHAPDIIHSHCPVSSGIVARTLRGAVKAPLITTYHTKFDIDVASSFESSAMRKTALKFIVSNINASDEVWAVCSGAGRNLESIGYEGKWRVMPNGVDFPRASASASAVNEINMLHSFKPNAPVFLFVGRMRWYKGIRTILDGLFHAKQLGVRFRMVFIGSGEELAEIKETAARLGIADDCVFTGPVYDRERLRAYYSRADMYLFPSSFDNAPIVVREASACSTASMLLRGSDSAEGVTDGVNGVLIDDSAQALCDAVVRLSGNPDSMRILGENAARDLYLSWDGALEMAVERYRELLEEFKRGI